MKDSHSYYHHSFFLPSTTTLIFSNSLPPLPPLPLPPISLPSLLSLLFTILPLPPPTPPSLLLSLYFSPLPLPPSLSLPFPGDTLADSGGLVLGLSSLWDRAKGLHTLQQSIFAVSHEWPSSLVVVLYSTYILIMSPSKRIWVLDVSYGHLPV